MMPKGIYKRKPFSDEHKLAISASHIGNTYSRGKNIGNKYAVGKVCGDRNGNWKGGISNRLKNNEIIAGRERPNVCELCYEAKKTDFDHCHKTGLFRGWICRRCNLVLGLIKDNPILSSNITKYLIIRDEKKRPKLIINSLLTINGLSQDDIIKEDIIPEETN